MPLDSALNLKGCCQIGTIWAPRFPLVTQMSLPRCTLCGQELLGQQFSNRSIGGATRANRLMILER
jgi:hypothetical protein